MKKIYLAAFFFFAVFNNVYAQTSIMTYGASWKYLANGTNQGTAWRASGFNDVSWTAGNGQFGYGDGDETTVVSYGPNASTKYVTTYFRKTVSISNPSSFSGFTVNVKRDDGIVVYINGTERYRNNMPAGTIGYTTLASAAASDDGATAQSFTLSPSVFITGNNVIAVEIHQNSRSSSDLSFDMEIWGTTVTPASTFIAYGSSWKYRDNGSDQGTAWRAPGFDDATWLSGNAQLGYGDADETTPIGFGTNASNKFVTTYFRKTIGISNPNSFTGFTLRIRRDDGAVVYLNGTEVYRTNMPAGTISYTTLASSAASDDGNTAQVKTLTPSQFITGNNTIAVEVHQNSVTSTDLSFDLELTASGGSGGGITASLTRGPYLNSALQTGIVIRWRTNIATNTKVSFGAAAGNLNQTYTDNSTTTEHIATLTGLTPNTLYYYSIGSTTQNLQGDASNYFKTLPAAGSKQKVRVWAMGDMGNNSSNQQAVRNAYLSHNGNNYTDAWILLGDNAYANGTDAEFQGNFFNVYQGNVSKNHVLWPSPGNHDYAGSSARQADHAIPYYDMFSLPQNGQAGGLSSGTEAFYSYNLGNVHMVSLDSYGWETGNTRFYDTLGRQATWLKQDLAANTLRWVVVYFHHPPYSKGSHNSDTDAEEIRIRQNLVPIFERYKVDLVLCGHSHIYERSYLINGHYGTESTFSPATHALSTSSAKFDGSANSCPYVKNTGHPKNGVVYAVVGSAGQLGGTSTGYPHNAMYYSNNTNGGSLLFEVEDNRLDAKWISADGVVRDNFTILKEVNKTTQVNTTAGATVTLTAPWNGNYTWSTGATGRSITVNPSVNTTYTVRDASGCLLDTYQVVVSSNGAITFQKPKE